jgi:hypothetical protein
MIVADNRTVDGQDEGLVAELRDVLEDPAQIGWSHVTSTLRPTRRQFKKIPISGSAENLNTPSSDVVYNPPSVDKVMT